MNNNNNRVPGRILIVDDEESIRMTFEMFLRRAGYDSVTLAASVEEALEAVKSQVFDLIISDIVLEGSLGTDLLRQVRSLGVECPVVMITGFPNLDSAAEAVRLGAFDYIPKPVNKDTLLRFTRQALQHWQLQEEKIILQKQNDRYRRFLEVIFRSVQDAIITVNRDMEIVELNDTAKEWMKDKMAAENLPENLEDLPGEIGVSCLQDALKVINMHEEVREHRVESEQDDGSLRVLSLNAAPLQDEQDEFAGVVLVIRDITGNVTRQDGRRHRFHGFSGVSTIMQPVYDLIEHVGKVDVAVLVLGESGTGKELAAEALHGESPRKDGPLIKVDCTAIAENLLESELFGHKKGAFTGADRDREGRILQADGGTLFLDEIGNISPHTQLRLLRFLQEKSFYPVGRDTPVEVDVRIIAATNADLKAMVNEGKFREDLYYRLRVVEIRLPPLRDRVGDVEYLARYFLSRFSGGKISGISDSALAAFKKHPWPGNVRELRHVIERACVLCKGATLSREHLPDEVLLSIDTPKADVAPVIPHLPPEKGLPVSKSLDPLVSQKEKAQEEERLHILNVMQECEGNKAQAARILGMDRSTLYRKLHRYNIDLDSV